MVIMYDRLLGVQKICPDRRFFVILCVPFLRTKPIFFSLSLTVPLGIWIPIQDSVTSAPLLLSRDSRRVRRRT